MHAIPAPSDLAPYDPDLASGVREESRRVGRAGAVPSGAAPLCAVREARGGRRGAVRGGREAGEAHAEAGRPSVPLDHLKRSRGVCDHAVRDGRSCWVDIQKGRQNVKHICWSCKAVEGTNTLRVVVYVQLLSKEIF